MSFNARLALSIMVLVACTGVMGIAGLFTLNELHARAGASEELYDELRGVYEIGHRAATARLLLNAANPDDAEIRRQLIGALRETDQLLAKAADETGGSSESFAGPLRKIRSGLEAALVADRGSDDPAKNALALNSSLGHVARIATAAKSDILANRRRTAGQVETARWMLGALFGGALVLAVVLGLAQHRAISRPMRVLRQGIERMAGHQTRQPLPERGPREFRRLIRQFNTMADSIWTLEQSLSQQVEVKSRQLIRSERLAGLGYLAAGLAHEINNPLGVIGGYAETMLRRLDATAIDGHADTPLQDDMRHDLSDSLRIISDEVFRCRDITTGLLQMTRHGDEQAETLDLRVLVERVVQMIRRLPLCKGRQLVIDQPHSAPLLARGSRSQLTQVFLNLINNALEAVEPGRGVVTVSIASQAGSALIAVADNGCGMTPESLDRVFDPLFTDKPHRGLTGVGLGLSVSHGIIERHGGRLDARSDGPGLGSTFLIELPAICPVSVVEP